MTQKEVYDHIVALGGAATFREIMEREVKLNPQTHMALDTIKHNLKKLRRNELISLDFKTGVFTIIAPWPEAPTILITS